MGIKRIADEVDIHLSSKVPSVSSGRPDKLEGNKMKLKRGRTRKGGEGTNVTRRSSPAKGKKYR